MYAEKYLDRSTLLLSSKKTIYSVFTILLYKLTLEIIYINAISPRYYYQGFIVDFSFSKYTLSTLLVLFMIYPMILLLRRANTSSIIVLLICMAYFIPGSSLYGLANLNDGYFLFFSFYWIFLMVCQFVIPSIKGNRIRGNPIVFHIIIFGFALFSLVMSGIYTNFRINLDLSLIYVLREETRQMNIPTVLEYIQSAATMVLPIGTIYYIVNKMKIASVAIILIQLLEFSFAGKKSILVMAIVAILVALFYKRNHLWQVLSSFLLLNIVSLIEFFFRSGFSDLAKYIHRRVLYMPSLISSHYYDFFSNNELQYLRQSVFRWFGASSPYSDPPIQRLIGYLYFGNIENNANTGLVGDAFSNFGWMAFLIYPALLIFLFRFFELCTDGVNEKILALLWVITFYKFVSGSFFTVLLNGGFILACVIMFVCPRKKIEKRETTNEVPT